jgi:cell division protein FtsL
VSSPARRLQTSPRPVPVPQLRPVSSRRLRRSRAAFLAFAGFVLGIMVLGLVFMNVVVAQSSFRLDDLSASVEQETRRVEDQRLEVARLSAPARIAREAKQRGLRLPDPRDVVYLPPDDGRAAEGGA